MPVKSSDRSRRRTPKISADVRRQRLEIPLSRSASLAGVVLDHAVEPCSSARVIRYPRVSTSSSSSRDPDLAFEQLAPQRVDALALLVHHVVVLEQVLADREVLASTCFWARSMALVTMPCSIGTPSSMPSCCIRPEMRSDPKIRIRSSCSDR